MNTATVLVYSRLVPGVVYRKYSVKYRLKTAAVNAVNLINSKSSDWLAVIKF